MLNGKKCSANGIWKVNGSSGIMIWEWGEEWSLDIKLFSLQLVHWIMNIWTATNPPNS